VLFQFGSEPVHKQRRILFKKISMRGEQKDNILSEKILAEVIADDIKINQKSSIDSSSCNKPEKKVNMPRALRIVHYAVFVCEHFERINCLEKILRGRCVLFAC
jgi:hypothetical protein